MAESAGYTLLGLELEIAGQVTRADCERCGEDVLWLTIPGTEQVFELFGDFELGVLRLKSLVKDWKGEHPRLVRRP